MIRHLLFTGLLVVGLSVHFNKSHAAENGGWKQLFNGKDLTGWDTYLAPPPGESRPLGLNNDPRGVFTVVPADQIPAIRVSGEIYGALTTKEAFENFHMRVVFKWGEKRWPPRETVGRDSGILYCCVGPDGAGSGAWMRSVECNIMEKGIGQWWSVAGAIIDVEGELVTRDMEPMIPYKKESSGERIIVYKKGAPQITVDPSAGITASFDDEKPLGQWNTVEVVFWAGNCLHLLNGKVNMVLTNPRYVDAGKRIPLRSGKIQLQSEAAELFYSKVEIRPIDGIPAEHLDLVPSAELNETGFKPLFGKTATAGWAQCGPGTFALEDGIATGHDGMGLWWHTNQPFANFVLRGDFMQNDGLADSGIFVRFPNPGNDPWVAVHKGHEIEIGDANPEKPTWRTGSIYPFHASTTANTKPAGQWNSYEIVCIGHNYSVRINGRLINTWTDPQRRTSAGYIGLQNYNDGKTVRHRNLRIKELP
jgi:hypothetical protein